jgi:mycothiol synthase
MTLPKQLNRRYYLPDDYPALVELIRAHNKALGNEIGITAEELAAIVEVPGFERRVDSFIFEDGGRIIAMSNQGFHPESGHCWADAIVHPDYWGQGIGAELLRLTETRCLEWAASALTPEMPVLLQLAAHVTNPRALRLFEAHRYQHVRSFNAMRIDLDQPISAPPLPEGFVLGNFDPARNARAVYEAGMDAFSEHWGFERDSFEDWTKQVFDHPYNDISLWLLAYDGDQLAGICVNRAGEGDDPRLGWVYLLGVRRPWRRRGLGEALLRTSFARFQARGFQRAGLMVDAANATNAMALYERAGMHVHKSKRVYHKILREGTLPEQG